VSRQRAIRDRRAFAGATLVDLLCPRCEKRVTQLYREANGPLQWTFLVKIQYSLARGVKDNYPDHAHEDWVGFPCPRCRFNWQGRRSTLAGLYESALARKAVRVHLPD
jgi:hypothetical protein